ncbi:MAG: 1-acyl-sn-glycerol-3-phosphate acyltransferase [Deltaproteobacteria bacterium]|nr:MAG: 1-acyl-sn-glycerol-3-phosphate acyltransferase [Deltaproteobacteria bacterium]
MRRAFRLASILLVSLLLAATLAATAWIVPELRRRRYRARFQQAWACVLCAVLGIRVEVIGDVPRGWNGLAIANHLGYTDILVLGRIVPGTFVSKADVARWPVIGLLASIAGTVYVDREDRAAAGAFAAELKTRIAAGDTLLLFPEGTSTRGETILPFKTAPFAAVAGLPGKTVLPLHVDVVEIEGVSATGLLRDAVCWHGDAELVPHLYRLSGLRNIRYRIVIGPPILCEGRDRKVLARISREKVEALGKVSDRQGCQLPGDLIWIRSVP